VLKRQIEAGEPFDLAIMTAAVTDELIKQGRLVAAVGSQAREPAIANELLRFLTAPATASVDKAKGLEPGPTF
jgi:hypothetical protein